MDSVLVKSLHSEHLHFRHLLNEILDEDEGERQKWLKSYFHCLSALHRAEEREILSGLATVGGLAELIQELTEQHHRLENSLEQLAEPNGFAPGVDEQEQMLLFKQEMDFHFVQEETLCALAQELAPSYLNPSRCQQMIDAFRVTCQKLLGGGSGHLSLTQPWSR